MKTLVLELTKASCAEVRRELRKFQRNVDSKRDEVCRRIAEIGAQEANAHLTLAAGNTDAHVTVEQIDGGYKLVMSGKDVYFVEFGTGDDTNAHYPVSVPVFAGSWSVEHAKKYSEQGWWYYGGKKYTGTPAYMPMYYAEKKMREEMPRIVKEVMGK